MPADTTVKDYFKPDARRELIDRAALIVALVDGRESATRTDYAHPKLSAIVEVLKSCSEAAAAAKPAGTRTR
jgi:hypothetical protein